MFLFGSATDGVFTLVQDKDHVYTWSSEREAMEYFPSATNIAHLYQMALDFSRGWLIRQGANTLGCPAEFVPTEEQKHALFHSYKYPSLLEWAPLDHKVEI